MSIDCDWNDISSLLVERNILYCKSRQQVASFAFCFGIIGCKDDVFLAFTATKFMNENFENVP